MLLPGLLGCFFGLTQIILYNLCFTPRVSVLAFFGKTLVVSKSSDLFGLISLIVFVKQLIGYRDYHLGIWWSSYHHGTSVGTSKQVRPYDHRNRSVSRSDRVSPGRGSRVISARPALGVVATSPARLGFGFGYRGHGVGVLCGQPL